MRILITIGLLAWSGWAFGSGPLVPFTQNKGQWPAQVLYRANIPGGVLFVERNALTYVLKAGGDLHHHGLPGEHPHDPLRMHAYRVTFEGSTGGIGEGRFAQPHYENHFIGNDPAKWGSQCAVYGEVWVKDIYPGVDLRLKGQNGLKYDLVLAPGVEPGVIRMRYEGQDGLALKDGDLIVKTSAGSVVEEAPISYNRPHPDGVVFDPSMLSEVVVPSRYLLHDDLVRFDVAKHAHGLLTIDPTLTFGSYSGSTADNFGFTATYDNDGHLYGGGIVFGIGYPTTLGVLDASFNGGGIDIGISKWLPDGSALVWSTYLGGSLGNETPHSLVVNDNNELFVLGATGSSDFAVTPGCYDGSFNSGVAIDNNNSGWLGISGYGYSHLNGTDIFVAHFNAAATALIGSTYIGGSNNDGLNNTLILTHNYGDAFRGEIVLDAGGNPVVVTSTESSDAPISPGAPQPAYGGGQDAYLFRMNPALTALPWATYYGGWQRDSGYGLQLDSNGEVFVTGGTLSFDLPLAGSPYQATPPGLADGYLARFNATGTTLLGSTFIGTPSYDQSYKVQLNLADEVFVLGQTNGTFPVTTGKYANAGSSQFIQKYDHSLSTLEWSTVVGNGSGSEDLSPSAFLVSDCGQIYLSGWAGLTGGSSTTGFPTSTGAFQTTTDGSDFYLMVLEPEATALNYATFFGGSTSNEHVDGGTSRFDKNGNVYQAVCAGCQGNDDFPTSPGAWSNTNNSSNCNLGVFKFALTQPNAIIDINGPSYLCLPNATAVFDNLSLGGTDFSWTFGDGTGNSTQFEPTYTFGDTGSYTVTMILTDSNSCVINDTAQLVITVIDPLDAYIDPIDTLCPGASVQLLAHGGHAYTWFPATGLSNANIANPVATPASTTTYSVAVTDSCGTDTVSIAVFFGTPFGEAGPDTIICLGDAVPITALGGGTYSWSQAGTLNDPAAQSPLASPNVTTQYVVTITTPEGCVITDSLVVNVETTPPVPVSSDTSVCEAGSVQLQVSGGTTYTWLPAPGLSDLDGPDPVVSPIASTTYFVNVGNSCGLTLDSVFVEVQVVVTDAWPDTIICPGESVSLFASGAPQYDWSPATGLSSTTGSPITASPSATTTYRVIASSTAGCTDTAFVTVDMFPEPSVDAGPDQQIDFGDKALLRAAGNGLIVWLPDPSLSCIACTDPVAFPQVSTIYTVTLTDTNGCKATDDVFVIVDGTLYVPNTFTPDGDGINDVFFAKATEVKTFKLYVFNRWGDKIFESDRLDRFWDGSFKGTDSPIDTYVWRIDLTELSGEAHVHYGHVNLVR